MSVTGSNSIRTRGYEFDSLTLKPEFTFFNSFMIEVLII